MGDDDRLYFPDRRTGRTHGEVILAHHLIFTGYGHWLPNDPRGSGSAEVREGKLKDLGAVHFGRKRDQPPRDDIREFYRVANDRLMFEPVWFDEEARRQIGKSFGEVVKHRKYTVWGCAVLSNHVHLCVRRHRDTGEEIWKEFAERSREEASGWRGFPAKHPVWAQRPYVRYLFSPDDIRNVIRYIRNNPLKEGLPSQQWDFVQRYDGWPYQKR